MLLFVGMFRQRCFVAWFRCWVGLLVQKCAEHDIHHQISSWCVATHNPFMQTFFEGLAMLNLQTTATVLCTIVWLFQGQQSPGEFASAMKAARLEHSDLVQHQVGIVQQFREFWIENHLCDVVLKSNDGSEHRAHAAVLSASSMFFKNLLGGSFLEADQVQRGQPVEMDASKATLVALLDFIYGGQPELNLEDGIELLRLADRWELSNLAGAIEKGFCASLDSSGALRVLEEEYGLDDLKAECEEMVAEDFESCIQQPEFGKLSATQLARILKRSDLSVSREEVVVQGIFKWLTVSKDRNTSLGMLLQLVDFQSVSVENLLRLGRFSLSGPAGGHLQREVRQALRVRHRKRPQSSDNVQPKRQCLQHWSPDLGASSHALRQEVLSVPCNSLCWHDGAIYGTDFRGNIISWKPGDAATDAQRVVGEGAAVAGINDLGQYCKLAISPSGNLFVKDYDHERFVSFENGYGRVVFDENLLADDVAGLFCSPAGICSAWAWRGCAEVGGFVVPDSDCFWDSSSRPAVQCSWDFRHQGRRDLSPWWQCYGPRPHSAHRSGWAIETRCGGTGPKGGLPGSTEHVCHGSWHHLCHGWCSKKGVGIPPRQHTPHRSLAVSWRFASDGSAGSWQLNVCKHGGYLDTTGHRRRLRIYAASWVAAWVKNHELTSLVASQVVRK